MEYILVVIPILLSVFMIALTFRDIIKNNKRRSRIYKYPINALENIEKIEIGRAVTNDIVISDSTISKKHAEIRLCNKTCYIRDLGSKNGTIIGKTSLHETDSIPIKSGTTVFLGKRKYKVKYSSNEFVLEEKKWFKRPMIV